MRLAGGGIHIHQLAAIEIGQMLSVGRPGELVGRLADERAMREDCFDRRALLRAPVRCRASSKSDEQEQWPEERKTAARVKENSS